ncbi:biopolymer transporter ExbB [Amaricoccus sp.]|uniref:biopolymer transporter ExbB n=1 Tax=Amaricoccus sp. TaxID=1872485 RepID=UPI0026354F52|nr:biopolymer transporter ExbB [Amaricoccus sp.]HRO11744.1 biopolymer transporter ExbB [Amaricoccus sp.]
MVLSQTAEPHFSQPVRQIVLMLIVLGLTAALAVLIFPVVQEIFLASPYLKIFILLVFFVGVLACFWQVFTLITSVSWIEGFAIDRPGHEFTRPPRLLAPLAVLLSGRRARRSLTSTSTRSILESVATRIEEQRDLTRYIINLLIFLGLLGTFYGLATVVPAVVNTIRSLAPQEGQSAVDSFDSLMHGLEGQLGGMGTAFGSSLLGLSGSLVVGLLELFASHAQNRFYRELEEWLSSITKLGVTGVEPEEALTAANVLTVIGQTAEQIDQLREVVEQGVARSAETETRIGELATLLARPPAPAVDNALLERIAAGQERMVQLLAAQPRGEGHERHDRLLLERIAQAQERMVAVLGARDEEGGGIDAETRSRLRSIDTQVLRILEDLSAGRQDLVTEIRQDIAGLAEALRQVAARGRY